MKGASPRDPYAAIRPLVRGFAIDHRNVGPGFVFGAFRGARFDGESVMDEAVRRGAIAIVARPEAEVAGALHLADPAPRRLFARLAAPFYAPYPATIAAVTGTNGKTSVAEFARQLWRMAGHDAATIGTLGVRRTGAEAPTSGLTTPDILTFLQRAAALARDGATHLLFEASSHGLAQYRTEGLPVALAAFTNLTRDHLDYHKTMEAYFAAKLRLFTEVLDRDGVAIVWRDQGEAGAAYAERLLENVRGRGVRAITVGPDGADLRLVAATPTPHGQKLQLLHRGETVEIELPLVGLYQAANALVAAAIVAASGDDEEQTLRHLARLEGVRGRLELAATNAAGAAIYVDYAHTPDGLRAAMAALRPHAARRLIVVFGCGGDRDRGKRPEMGRIAAAKADLVFVTDDNPRSEDPAAIRAAIMAAAPGAREIADRRAAIAAAVGAAGSGDIVLLAGKGHEQGQIVGDKVLHFDDAEEARLAVKARP